MTNKSHYFLVLSVYFFCLFAFAPLSKAETAPMRLSETLIKGRSLSLNLGQTGWELSGSNNSSILSASVEGENLQIQALNFGLATAYACPNTVIDPSLCAYVTITVIPENVLGLTTTSSYQPHALGSFINVGQTLFYVHQYGLIPITTYPIFLSIAPKKFTISPANNYDMQLPLLPFMETGDQRVK